RFGSEPLRERAHFRDELTEREIQILRALAEGLGNKQIASSLAISEHTVKFHISSILDKLEASSRTEAVTIGIRMGLYYSDWRGPRRRKWRSPSRPGNRLEQG